MQSNCKTITIRQPDDWHTHLRDDAYLARTVSDTEKQFARAIVMPNVTPPITTLAQAIAYRDRIMSHVTSRFIPLMTLYLTESMDPSIIFDAKKSGVIIACKYYPAHATTHSDAGIVDIKKIYPLLEAMQACDLPLCIHGESMQAGVDIFDREKIFLDTLKTLQHDFPKLRMVLEHISTQAAVDFILAASNNITATITPHHLHYNRNDLFDHGIRPHYFCAPILKCQSDQAALIHTAVSGNPKFFLGTDSAPHTQAKKESACGCAGIYSAHAALALYADIFEKNNALDRLENFASRFGAEFYQLPLNSAKITLIKNPWKVPDSLSFGDAQLIPMKAGEMLAWQIQS